MTKHFSVEDIYHYFVDHHRKNAQAEHVTLCCQLDEDTGKQKADDVHLPHNDKLAAASVLRADIIRMSCWSSLHRSAVDQICRVTPTDVITSFHRERIVEPWLDRHLRRRAVNLQRPLSSFKRIVEDCIADKFIITTVSAWLPVYLGSCGPTSNGHIHRWLWTVCNINVVHSWLSDGTLCCSANCRGMDKDRSVVKMINEKRKRNKYIRYSNLTCAIQFGSYTNLTKLLKNELMKIATCWFYVTEMKQQK